MLSKWQVREVFVAGTTFYQVYRTTDAVKLDERTEARGGFWSTEREAWKLADCLNNGGDLNECLR